MALPIVGKPDWKWLVIGVVLVMFVWPRINGAIAAARAKNAPPVKAK